MFVYRKSLLLVLVVMGYTYGDKSTYTKPPKDQPASETTERTEKQSTPTKEDQLLDFLEMFGQPASNKTDNQTSSDSTEKPVQVPRLPSTNQTLLDILEKFKMGEYSFRLGQDIEVYNPMKSKLSTYKVHTIESYDNCIGITTDAFETVVLECPGKKPERPGCFEVFTPKAKPENSAVVPEREIKVVCLEIMHSKCVGITTNNFWIIRLSCSSVESKRYKRTESKPSTTTSRTPPLGSIISNIRSNRPPRM